MEIIKMKDLPYLTQVEEILDSDRIVATIVRNEQRQTVCVPINYIQNMITNYVIGTPDIGKVHSGYSLPSLTIGQDGDMYVMLVNPAAPRVKKCYIKYESKWIEFNFRRR